MQKLHWLWTRIDSRPLITDSIAALVLTGLALLNLQFNWIISQPEIHPAWAIIITTAAVLPLTLRRKFPISVLLFITGVFMIKTFTTIPEGFGVSIEIAILSAAAFGGRGRNLACWTSFILISGCVVYLTFSGDLSGTAGNQTLLRIYTLAWNLILIGAAWLFGATLRSRRERTLELEEKTIQLEHEREENARRAVLGERLRIARELHDVLAHHVSVMGIQAGAARRTMKQHPEKAQEALSSIEKSSRQAVDELHRLLGFLRQQNDTDDLKPQPRLKQLNELVTQIRQAGLPVEVKIQGQERQLPPAVDLSAYRIVEEALTNTLKHAGPAKAVINLHYLDDILDLEILDDGAGKGDYHPNSSDGKGLIGMRERVTLLGGEFSAGRISGVGFSVQAKLPLSGRMT